MIRWLAPLGLLLVWSFTFRVYLLLPERIPVHWNLQGAVDRYGSRLEVFLLPVVLVLLYSLLALAPRLDPKLKDQKLSAWPWLTAGLVVSLGLLQGAILYTTWRQVQGEPFPIERAILGAVGVAFLLLSAPLYRLPPNYFAGVRTPWTLESPRVWRSTHQRAGLLFALMGGWALLLGLLGVGGGWFWVWFVAFLLGSFYLVVFSYLAWRRNAS